MAFGHSSFAERAFATVGLPGIIIPVAQLTITPVAPAVVVDFRRTIPVEQLIITAVAATVVIDKSLTVPTQNLQFSFTAPTLDLTLVFVTPRLNLAITLTAPQRVRETNPTPAETPWRDVDVVIGDWTAESSTGAGWSAEDAVTDDWTEQDEAA